MFPVAGEVFFEGNPAKHVMVVLHPVDEAARAEIWPQGYPQGTVNADGSFQISTYEQEDGAPEGEYLILVVPTDAALNEPQRVTGDAPSAEVASGRGPGERFSTPDNPAGRCVVEAKDNKLPRLSLTGGA